MGLEEYISRAEVEECLSTSGRVFLKLLKDVDCYTLGNWDGDEVYNLLEFLGDRLWYILLSDILDKQCGLKGRDKQHGLLLEKLATNKFFYWLVEYFEMDKFARPVRTGLISFKLIANDFEVEVALRVLAGGDYVSNLIEWARTIIPPIARKALERLALKEELQAMMKAAQASSLHPLQAPAATEGAIADDDDDDDDGLVLHGTVDPEADLGPLFSKFRSELSEDEKRKVDKAAADFERLLDKGIEDVFGVLE